MEARLGKPSLIRETSRLTLAGAVRHPILVSGQSYLATALSRVHRVEHTENLVPFVFQGTLPFILFNIIITQNFSKLYTFLLSAR